MRTTIDIDDPILEDIRQLQAQEGKSMGRIVSDLLAQALAAKASSHQLAPAVELKWVSQRMGARVDLADRDAILDAMDRADAA
jgi:hypothetical protein